MDHLVSSRRKVLGQMAFSAVGILGLSATNKVFADESGGVSVSSGNSSYPYIHARVNYRFIGPDRGRAVGAVVTIQCVQRRITLSKATDINGGAMFRLHDYFHGRPERTSFWKITVNFRGRIQQRNYTLIHNSYINSEWNFYS